MDLGVRPYRRMHAEAIECWSSAYRQGERDYSGPAEAARYGILAGYLRLVDDPSSILDFGCGTGILLERIQGIPFHEYIGVDSSPVAIELARKRVPGVGTFVVAEDMPTTAGPFDVIIFNEVLYYLSDPGAMLDQCQMLLRPGGSLLTSIWRHRGDRSLHRMIDARFELVYWVEVRNLIRRGTGRWPHARYRGRVAWHRSRTIAS
jgi:2-polyprenyl-3-methyl-5-hydroxy-6-metoxy-1,4-benzoquinol methylase